MSFDYSSVAADALATLNEFGQTVTRHTHAASVYDEDLGVATQSETTSSRKGVVLPFDRNTTTVRGILVESTDVQLLLDATAAVTINDHFTISGSRYSIVSFEALNPAGTAVLYTIHLRKA